MHDFGRWGLSECAPRTANNTTDLPNVLCVFFFSGREPGKVGDRNILHIVLFLFDSSNSV